MRSRKKNIQQDLSKFMKAEGRTDLLRGGGMAEGGKKKRKKRKKKERTACLYGLWDPLHHAAPSSLLTTVL